MSPTPRLDGVEALEGEVLRRIALLLSAARVDPSRVACRIDVHHGELAVDLSLPSAVGLGVRHALAVRVLDAVQAADQTYGHVDVNVHW